MGSAPTMMPAPTFTLSLGTALTVRVKPLNHANQPKAIHFDALTCCSAVHP